jgi:hypothetical protein
MKSGCSWDELESNLSDWQGLAIRRIICFLRNLQVRKEVGEDSRDRSRGRGENRGLAGKEEIMGLVN